MKSIKLKQVFRDEKEHYHIILLPSLGIKMKTVSKFSFGFQRIRKIIDNQDYMCYDLGFIYFPWRSNMNRLRPWKGIRIMIPYGTLPVIYSF